MSNNQIKEINKIMEDYTTKQPTKLDELKSLDRKVKRPATVFAYVFGSVSSLVLGLGMCLAMKVIFASNPFTMPLGIIIGVIGLILCGVNYPIYKKSLEKRKKKYADKVIKLSNEILNENN